MGIDVLKVELLREIGNAKTYKIIYQEETEIETTLVGKHLTMEKMRRIFLKLY